MKKQLILLMFLTLFGFLLLSGCGKETSKRFSSAVSKYDKVPKISVFMKDTGKKKKLDLEEYLVGVVAGEMKPNWPKNAYAAQAILARTFTLEFLGRGGTWKLHGTDISTDETEAQAYNAANITPLIREAVSETRGQVLTYKGQYIRGWYSAGCGGVTAYAKEGLAYRDEEPPYISSVQSIEEDYMPEQEFFWTATLNSSAINKALKKLGKPEVGTVQKMEVVEWGPTKRAVKMRFSGSKGNTEVNGADFRVAYDPKKIRSILIEPEIVNKSGAIIIKGKGFGHGVGLSQWGAYSYAKRNWTPEQIVKHFYPLTDLESVW